MVTLTAIAASIAASTAAASAAASAAFTAFTATAVGGFIATQVGALVIGLGIQLLTSSGLFAKKQSSPTIEAGKVNVKINEPERWLNAGIARSGGAALFGEFDTNGAFWYLVVHSDSILSDTVRYYFDDLVVGVDGNKRVITGDFMLDQSGNAFNNIGVAVPYFTIYTTTYTAANPITPQIQELKDAFPEWTDDHLLVGTTYSVIKIDEIETRNRFKIYKWRGPFGLGEPAIGIVGEWSKIYDPRDVTQNANDESTYKFSKNPVLIWAWFRTHLYGRNKSNDTINWSKIGEQADICDIVLQDKDLNDVVTYECGISIPESKERSTAEQEILQSCDGQIVFDDDGKAWVRVGYFYEPELILNRNRDISGMKSVEAIDGESETQGVIVKYINPESDYAIQSSAPWKNPNYFITGVKPDYLTVEILTCQNHNQAIRLAKAIGHRSQPLHKLAPIAGLRGLRARQERIIELKYDQIFKGNYEIVTNVEIDKLGIFTSFGTVPVDSDRWLLLAGEEPDKPVIDETSSNNDPILPQNVAPSFVNNTIKIVYDAKVKLDDTYHFQYRKLGDTDWIDMINNDLENFAISGVVVINTTYELQWESISVSGKSTGFQDPPDSILTFILTLAGVPVLEVIVNIAYAPFTLSASGGTIPYTFVDLFGRLPTGITIDSVTGIVSGVPDTAGIYPNIILRAIDINNAINDLDSFTIVVSEEAP